MVDIRVEAATKQEAHIKYLETVEALANLHTAKAYNGTRSIVIGQLRLTFDFAKA